MNKREAAEHVHRLTARSLRNLAWRQTQWVSLGLPGDLTEHQRGKVAAAMVELADKLEAKFPQREPIEHGDPSEPGHPDNERSTM